MAVIMLLSNCPARPTNGSPCASSSAPGPSPMNISSAFGSPVPKTICLRPNLASLQRWQLGPMSSRMTRSCGSSIFTRGQIGFLCHILRVRRILICGGSKIVDKCLAEVVQSRTRINDASIQRAYAHFAIELQAFAECGLVCGIEGHLATDRGGHQCSVLRAQPDRRVQNFLCNVAAYSPPESRMCPLR